MSELQRIIHTDSLGAKITYWTPTVASPTKQMKLTEQNVVVNLHTITDGTVILTLPSVSEAVGKFYYIGIPDVNDPGTSGDCSLYVMETAAELTTNGDMDADGDYLILFSDGINWRTIVDGVA